MRKCRAFAIVKSGKILSLTFVPVNTKYPVLEFIGWDDFQETYGYVYSSIYDITLSILSIMKSNGFSCDYYEEFGGKIYDIYIMDLERSEKSFDRYLIS